MRKRGKEALSVGFIVILIINIASSIALATLVGLSVLDVSDPDAFIGAIIGVDGAFLGFLITMFELYFTYNMPQGVKELLIEYGFYVQIPRDMLRSIIMLTISIILAVACLFVKDLAQKVLVVLAIVQFIYGLVLALYVTFRFFTILKHQ